MIFPLYYLYVVNFLTLFLSLMFYVQVFILHSNLAAFCIWYQKVLLGVGTGADQRFRHVSIGTIVAISAGFRRATRYQFQLFQNCKPRDSEVFIYTVFRVMKTSFSKIILSIW